MNTIFFLLLLQNVYARCWVSSLGLIFFIHRVSHPFEFYVFFPALFRNVESINRRCVHVQHVTQIEILKTKMFMYELSGVAAAVVFSWAHSSRCKQVEKSTDNINWTSPNVLFSIGFSIRYCRTFNLIHDHRFGACYSNVSTSILNATSTEKKQTHIETDSLASWLTRLLIVFFFRAYFICSQGKKLTQKIPSKRYMWNNGNLGARVIVCYVCAVLFNATLHADGLCVFFSGVFAWQQIAFFFPYIVVIGTSVTITQI